jgi:hypothetical protein
MRRTAITEVLILDMPEQLVRKINGHAPGSKEFYRYTYGAHDYLDKATKKKFSLQKSNITKCV